MAAYSLNDIAKMYGVSKQTTRRHIRKLSEEKKFKKVSVGMYYTDADVEKLALLLGFHLVTFSSK